MIGQKASKEGRQGLIMMHILYDCQLECVEVME
jgi:hypothetical protein